MRMVLASPLPRRACARVSTPVSALSLGTVKIGRNVNVKNKCGDHLPLPSPAEVQALLDTAEALGVNVLDTAPAYGVAEERLGSLLKSRKYSFLISSKVGEEFDGQNSHYDFGSAQLQRSVERSLTRLNLTHLDFLFLHCPREDLPVVTNEGIIQTLQTLKNQGKVRHIGASTATVDGGLAACSWADVLMVAYNANYTEQQGVLCKAQECGVGVFLKKALMQGYADKQERARSIRLCLQAPGVLSLVAGTTNPEHLRENCADVLEPQR